ncbi:MAG: thioesterase domain-containing protein [Xanthobacteraceae bacterium]
MRRVAADVFLIAALSVAPAAAAQNAKPVAHAAPAHASVSHSAATHDDAHAHVYLMRGLLNIFSLGMDQLAAQIARNGIDATVYNHSVEEAVVGAIVQKFRAGDRGPYILVGHSLGADAVMVMAQQLNAQGVPVALVVPFDGTGSYAAPANVNCVFNLTQRSYAYMQAGAGFHGKLSNVDVSSDTSIDHVTIDKSPRLQAMALKEILQAARGQSCRPGATAPALARAKPSAPISPADTGSKENAAKDAAPAIPANTAPAKAPAPGTSASRAKTAVPAKGDAPAKNAAPVAPPKSATPAPSGAPEKSAAAAHAG